MSTVYASINLNIVPLGMANLSIQDLSIQRGFGIFDFLKIVQGKPIFLNDHIDRFYNSAKEMFLNVPINRSELKTHILKLLEKNNMPDAGLKFILTGGYSEDGYTLGSSNLILIQSYFKLNRNQDNSLIRLMSYPHQRQIPEVKTIDYLQAIRLQGKLKQMNADDILYTNQELVRECPRANLFIIKDKTIITPQNQILAGITRSKILQMNIPGYTIASKDFTLNDLLDADEVFVSSSTKNANAVSHVDGHIIGNGQAGNITQTINKKLWHLIDQEIDE